jgi:nucleotide-binding universal stress UspA family protein
MKILLAVDGSKPSLAAAKLLVEHADWYRTKPELELVTVHLPVPKIGNMRAAVSKAQIERYYREEGEQNLAAAKKLLERSGLAYRARLLVGPVAETIAKHAKSSRCDLIYLGTHGRSALADAFVGSTASKLLQISEVPVLLVR